MYIYNIYYYLFLQSCHLFSLLFSLYIFLYIYYNIKSFLNIHFIKTLNQIFITKLKSLKFKDFVKLWEELNFSLIQFVCTDKHYRNKFLLGLYEVPICKYIKKWF